ncbi:MAG: methylisocitrate lyase [Pirellulaceae bacterium]|nr:methylisocitrate lyase [Pirellulaceae bacterium]
METMTTTPSLAKGLREKVAQGTLQVPGAPNALAAKLIEKLGFPALYLSGGAFSAGTLAFPDIGLFTLTELVQETRRIASSTTLPLLVDADTGFGSEVNVRRTVEELEQAGASAIQLEDQTLPKRCGHLSGKTLVPIEEMCQKIAAAKRAQKNPETVLIARTDGCGVEGFESAITRAKAYVSAGADWIFPEALQTKTEFENFSREVSVPLLANMTEFGKSPLLTSNELKALGYRIVLYPVSLLRAAMFSMEQLLTTIKEHGTQQPMLKQMQTREELYDLLGYHDHPPEDSRHFS